MNVRNLQILDVQGDSKCLVRSVSHWWWALVGKREQPHYSLTHYNSEDNRVCCANSGQECSYIVGIPFRTLPIVRDGKVSLSNIHV